MFITIIVFIAILSVLVFAHELGHFWTARKFGVQVDEFGFGLPPRVFGFRKINGKWQLVWGKNNTATGGSTIFSLNWIPIGGFVKIKGENGDEAGDSDSFASKPIWQRLIMLSAGVFMNFVLTVVILIIGFGVGLPAVVSDDVGSAIVSDSNIQILEVFDNLPAQIAGIEVGDIILSIDEKTFENLDSVYKYIVSQKDDTVAVLVKRGDEELSYDVIVQDYDLSTGIGVSLFQTGIVRYPWYIAIWQGIKMSFIWLVTIVMAFAMLIKNLIVGAPTGVEVAGPVGIAVMTGQFARMGFIYVMQFTALLSLNLAIINFVPFPALDGGRVLFLIIEKIKGNPVNQKWENLAHNIGFILLMVLILFVTFKDVGQYGGG